MDGTSKCFLDRVCENYNNPAVRRRERWKRRIPEILIDYALKRAKLDPSL
jgi:hypothetical protein